MYGLVPRLFPDAPDSHPNLSADDPAYAQLEREVLDILRGHFRPEFLNRIDETILCHSLSREQIVHIVEIQLARVASYLEDRKITIERTENARELLASEGYDPAFGARPLKRVIQRMVLNALVNHLFAGDVKEGDHVIADVDLAMLGELTFTAKE